MLARARHDRRVDRHGARRITRNSLPRKKALDEQFQETVRRQVVPSQLGLGARRRLAVFVAALWLTAAAVVAATGVLELRNVGAARSARLVTAALLLMLVQQASAAGKCLLVAGIAVRCGDGRAWSPACPVVARRFEPGGGCRWLIAALACPSSSQRFLLDRRADQRGPRGARPDRGLPPISVDHRARAARPDARARGHARAVRALLALRDRAGRREPLGRALLSAACRGRGRRASSGFAWYSGRSSPWSDPGGFVGSVGSSLASTISSASTAPGSSSGSGGGGSSGGGGGGGGGGGW